MVVAAVSVAIAAGLSSFCSCAAVRAASVAVWIAAGLSSFCFCAAMATKMAVAARRTTVAVAANLAV